MFLWPWEVLGMRDGLERECIYFLFLCFCSQWWKHHKLPMTQRLGPRTLFMPPTCPTAACYCDWRGPFIPPVTEMPCWWDQIPSLNSSGSLQCLPSFVMPPLCLNASAPSFQLACLPSSLPSSIFPSLPLSSLPLLFLLCQWPLHLILIRLVWGRGARDHPNDPLCQWKSDRLCFRA